MANKYIRHGETYNGDGTSSAAATSDGGVGAWNNINIFEGTPPGYGTLDVGDVVYIRSQDASNANMDFTTAAARTFGSSAVTATNWITWIIDNGAVWAGIDGTISYNLGTSTTEYSATLTNYNKFICKTRSSLAFYSTGTDTTGNIYLYVNSSYSDGVFFNSTLNTNNRFYVANSTAGLAVVKNITFKIASRVAYAGAFACNVTGAKFTIINPDLEMIEAGDTNPVFDASTSTSVWVFGGKVYGVGAGDGSCLCESTNSSFELIGFEYPRTMALTYGQKSLATDVSAFGSDGGFGSASTQMGGEMDSRQDGNYPYLTATYPDSAATGWSWKLYPKGASLSLPLALDLAKVYTAAAATKTFTVEFLVSDSILGVDTSTVWIDGFYVDSTTGEKVYFSSQDYVPGTALTASTTTWNATGGTAEHPGYGAVTLDKYKFSYTTPSTIKQDTIIAIRLCCCANGVTSGDILFVCPDFRIE